MEPSLDKDSIDPTHTGTRQEGHQERPDELISIDSNDLHGRPQGAQGTARPPSTFPGFRPHTPRMKYLPPQTMGEMLQDCSEVGDAFLNVFDILKCSWDSRYFLG